MQSLPLTVVKETASSLSVRWTPPAGVDGYEFKRDGVRISNTWQPGKSSITFGKPDGLQHIYEVDGVTAAPSGVLTRPVPSPTTTAVTTTPTTSTVVTTTQPVTTTRPVTTTAPVTTTGPAQITVPPGGSWDAAYRQAKAGDVISVSGGMYGDQVISYRSDLANSGLPPVTFRVDGSATVSKLEIHGNDVVVDGNNLLNVTGYIDTEADSATNHPDHVTVRDAHSTSFGVFNADTVTFQNLDVGPATTGAGGIEQGNGFENKIGSAGGVVYSPRNVTLDGMRIHDQNGDAGRLQTGEHFGGLFLAGVQGLTMRNTVMQGNVVYNVQIQPINGAPLSNVMFDHDSFGCPVNWLYQNVNPLACDGQSSIQFDGTFPGITVSNSAFAEGGVGWGCYAAKPPLKFQRTAHKQVRKLKPKVCDLAGDTFTNNTFAAASPAAPPLP